MWMQNPAASGNFHDRNRFGSQYGQNSYNGGSAANSGAGDWKSKILESGQWLGGKVIELGGKLARGPSTDSIPGHYAQQMPRNDGRANWMADIRSNTTSFSQGGIGGYNASGGGYQNDFATERPKAYSDYGQGYSSNPSRSNEVNRLDHCSSDHHKSRHAKKKNESKKGKKKSKKNKKKQSSESDFSSCESEEVEEASISESTASEASNERRHKSKIKKKFQSKKKSEFYSESESEDEVKSKTSAEYKFSFDPAKLPPPPVKKKKEATEKNTSKKSKKDKKGKKSRRRSVASSTDESSTENAKVKAKKRSEKKSAIVSASVDLLGVDFDAHSASSIQKTQPSLFDPPPSQTPLQDLAGLSFEAPPSAFTRAQPTNFESAAFISAPSPEQTQTFTSNLLPENNIVNLNDLASEKKSLSAHPGEKRTLNELQKARGTDQLTPVMAIPMQHLQQQNFAPGGMMHLSMSMNQLQLSNDGSIQAYPNMQSQMMTMPPQMVRMVQPHMQVKNQVAPEGTQQTSRGLSTE
ncbi:uncharacterized protein PHALS_11802 [Plasmopara halstedii]|uniref:Uncharacterized protein n=1 Tax=Plasmopara halstedii TaxID=4781 RepID=A0A0P1ALA4_PLAHL|nr:uncharacterized protein PHALS_11802 [Plasmopara halstedii]CEG41457.1 hypothetical protein PHALS_11802 [Plasmopara halstedii]|eukprot:XP_024577826.1 hypothetical protein PHALS_11802 [Plasmopara halstedii]